MRLIMKNPKILYILISVFCVFAIIAGIYAQVIADSEETDFANVQHTNQIQELTQTEIINDFNDLFTNTLNLNGYDTTGIQKLNPDQEIVFSAYDRQESTDGYDINIHIPAININSELASTLNETTQATFINKANEILQKEDYSTKTIYSIDFTAYVNSDILSLVIRSTLKEGNSSQRVIVQTYNYNLRTNEQVYLNDIITLKQLNRDEVNAKIKEVVTIANQEDEALQSMGYDQVYIRDLNSLIYTVDYATGYFLGPNQELYIVYAYGNGEFTSKMDIVLFE